jgi:hypothetical protein
MDEEQPRPAKMALPNGYCALPLQQRCEYANAGPDLPGLRHYRRLPAPAPPPARPDRALISQAEQRGQQRLVEMNRTVEKNLTATIGGLTGAAARVPGHAPARPARHQPRRQPMATDQASRLAEHARACHEQTLARAQDALAALDRMGHPFTGAMITSIADVVMSPGQPIA